MKETEIKKLLKQQSAAALPAKETREKVKRDLGIADLPAEAETVRAPIPAFASARNAGKTGGNAGGKRAPLTAILPAAAVAVLLIVAILLFLLPKHSVLPRPGGTTDKFSDIKTTSDFYAYGAASVGTLLRSTESSDVLSASASAHANLSRTALRGTGNGSLTEEQIQTLNRYMPLTEELMSDGKIAHTDTTVPAAFDGYSYGMKISYGDLTGGAVVYYMYYNKTMLSAETEEDESEEEYAIDGVLLVGDRQYPVKGEQEVETEEEESESELSFTAQTGENSFLRVHREYETEENETEQKFVYTRSDNGRTTESVELEYEEENGETELLMTVRRDGEEDVLRFENRTENGVFRLAARGAVGGKNVSFTVEIVTDENGNSSYVYTLNDEQFGFDRPDFDDDDDDDDDRNRRSDGPSAKNARTAPAVL